MRGKHFGSDGDRIPPGRNRTEEPGEVAFGEAPVPGRSWRGALHLSVALAVAGLALLGGPDEASARERVAMEAPRAAAGEASRREPAPADLLRAVEDGDVEGVRRALEAGVSPDISLEGQTPLGLAMSSIYAPASEAAGRRLEIVRMLLAAGARLTEAELPRYLDWEPPPAVVRELMAALGQEEWYREDLVLSLPDRAQVLLPRSVVRRPLPQDAAVVSISESGQIRVSSGSMLSVPVRGPEDVRDFASSWMLSRGEVAAEMPPGGAGGARPVAVEVSASALEVDGRVVSSGELGSALLHLLERDLDVPVVVEPSPATSYGRVIEVLDRLLLLQDGEGAAIQRLSIPGQGSVEVPEDGGTASREPPAESTVTLKVDAAIPWKTVSQVLDALRQAGVKGVVFLTFPAEGEARRQRTGGRGPAAASLPGFLLGGIPWDLEPGTAEISEAGAEPPPVEARGPVNVVGDVQAPVKIHSPPPEYTEIARLARIQGVVIVEVVVDEEGNVAAAKIVKDLPMGLGQAALEAVKKWRFEPATLRGKPIPVYYNLTVTFRLGEKPQEDAPGASQP